jgi:hypothetical protein
MAIDESDEFFKEEREMGYFNVRNSSAGMGTLLEVILYKGCEVISSGFNEFTVLPDDSMTKEKGNLVVGYFADPNVLNFKPPRFFRVVQEWDTKNNKIPNDTNMYDIDYAAVYNIINLKTYNGTP